MNKLIIVLCAVLLSGCATTYQKIVAVPPGYSGDVSYVTGSSYSDSRMAYTIDVLRVNDEKLIGMGSTIGNVVEIPSGKTELLVYVSFAKGITGVKNISLSPLLESGHYYQVVATILDHKSEEFEARVIKHDKRSYFQAICDVQTLHRNQQIKYRKLETPACDLTE